MDWGDHQSRILDSLGQLYANDHHLLDVGVNEKTVTFRLGHYLIGLYPNQDVDCEYNRNGQTAKFLDPNDEHGKYPDIIIHKRGSNADNMIVIEAKKEGNNIGDDDMKLRGFTSPNYEYRYDFGIHITFNDPPAIDFLVYREGDVADDLTEQLNQSWQQFNTH